MPGQLFGYGRSDRSSKLIRGLESETPAGFRARRGFGHDPAPVTPDNALFASYKTPRVHHAARRGGSGVAGCGGGSTDETAPHRLARNRLSYSIPIFPRCITGWIEIAEI